MALHTAFLLYAALGGFLAWKWPRTFWPRLCVALYALATSIVGGPAPSPTWRTGAVATPDANPSPPPG
nr:DUF2784 family protein [Nocardiopsis sp. CNT312]